MSQVLLPRIALPFPTYNATSCYSGSFRVGPRVLYCTFTNKEIQGELFRYSNTTLWLVLGCELVIFDSPPPYGCKALNYFHGLITFNHLFLLLRFIAESEHYNESLKGSLAEGGEYNPAKGSKFFCWLDTLELQTPFEGNSALTRLQQLLL